MLIYLSFGFKVWFVIENKNYFKVVRDKYGKRYVGKIFFLMLIVSVGYVEEVNDRVFKGDFF